MAHPAPTFFATPAWSIAVCESNPSFKAYPLKCTLDSGDSVIVPLLRGSGGFLRWRVLIGLPYGAYTALLETSGLLAPQPIVDDVIQHLANQHGDSVQITLWPLGPQSSITTASKKTYTTSIIDLSRGASVALESMEGTSRRMAAQATRKGVVCAVERDRNAVDTYYEILQQAALAWGLDRPTIPKALLASLACHAGKDVEIWIARFNGKAVAGGVVLYGSQEAFFWSASTLPDYKILRANNALAVSIIQAAAERKVSWLNLGANEGLPAVQKFKRYLGATEISYFTISLERPVYRLVQSVRSRFKILERRQKVMTY